LFIVLVPAAEQGRRENERAPERGGEAVPALDEVVRSARALAREGLVDAFGHVSALSGERVAMITPALPLDRVISSTQLTELPLGGAELPAGVPLEAWLHRAIYASRSDVMAICRAQPPHVAAVTAAGLDILSLHGQGCFVGARVPVHRDAVLVRDEQRGKAVASALADGDAVVMKGNGAVTVGIGAGVAMARMYVLDASARLNLMAAAAGSREPLSPEETGAWRDVSQEILGRLWAHLDARA
jgi:HCOMODA/2-hydroxy-3-carboxy-muconic semialdehyde decarboxylase